MRKNKQNGGITLFQVVMAGIMFLVGARVLDLSLLDMAAAVQQLLTQITG